MRHLATLALTLASVYAASSASSQCSSPANAIDLQEHLLEACQPINSTGHRDLTTPCGVEASIQMQCIYNASPEKAALPDYEFPFRHTPLVSNETLRDCLCQSYIFDVMKGCSACNRANGGLSGFGWEEEESYDQVRSSYCAASATPTQNFADFMHSALATAAPSSGSTECTSVPLSSGTVTNIPYTPTVPLKEANNVTLPSPTETGKNATSYTSLMTSDGQIVPTSMGKGGSHRNKKGHDKDSSAAGAMSRAGVAVGSLGAAAMAIAAVVL